jgi:DNA-directed RNA polymerase subunit E'/Rpb7
MIIIKEISVSLDIYDPIGLYTDLENNLMDLLTRNYEGKCIASCFVKKIIRIKRIGECMINQDGDPNFGTIAIIFEAHALIYPTGEVINGCKVINRDKSTGLIIGAIGTTSIMVAAHKYFESIIPGQLISVVVSAAKYNVHSSKVAVSAVPYLPSRDREIYKLIGNITSAELVNNLISKIREEEEIGLKVKAANEKAWSTFESLLYPYNAAPTVPAGAKTVDIFDLAGEAGKRAFICRTKSGDQQGKAHSIFVQLCWRL